MALRYFNTFIDEEPEQVEASTGHLHRSKSWPQRCRSYTNVQTTDGVNYVTKLESKWSVTYGERLQMAPASATDETDVTPMTSQSGPVEAAGEASETDVTPMTSQSGPVEAAVEASENNESAPVAPALAVPPPGSGSHGHPALCRRPCIRLAKGSCEMGDACGYCHYEHDRNVSPDKRQRLLLNRMETSELLAVLLPHVRRSLEVAQIEAPDIILLLEAKVGSTTAPNVDHFLRRTLRRMPLSALLGLIMVRDGLRPFLEEQCEVLRCRLG